MYCGWNAWKMEDMATTASQMYTRIGFNDDLLNNRR
jgi:hypothetical protein